MCSIAEIIFHEDHKSCHGSYKVRIIALDMAMPVNNCSGRGPCRGCSTRFLVLSTSRGGSGSNRAPGGGSGSDSSTGA